MSEPMRNRPALGLFARTATILLATGIGGYGAASALADNGGPVTVTTVTSTVSSVPVPDPHPAVKPQPAPKPASHPKPAPAPHVVHTAPSVQPAPVVPVPATTPSARPRVKPVTHRPRAKQTHAKKAAVKPAKAPVVPTAPPSAPQAETKTGGGTGRSIWAPLFFFGLAAVLLTLLAAKILSARGVGGAWSPALVVGRLPRLAWGRRGAAREVIAELVYAPPAPLQHAPAFEPSTPTYEPEAVPTPAPTEAEAPIPGPEAPVFEPDVLLPPTQRAEEIAAEPVTEQPAEPPPPREPEILDEYCEIDVWRGYAKSRFYARLDVPDEDEEFAIAESPLFRFRGNGAPERRDQIDAAHRALIESLLRAGWEPMDSAGPWYSTRFRRALSAPQRVLVSQSSED